MAVRVICKNIGFRFLMKQYPLICLRVQSAAGSVLKYYKRATIILPIEAEMATKAEIQSVIDPLLRKNSLKKSDAVQKYYTLSLLQWKFHLALPLLWQMQAYNFFQYVHIHWALEENQSMVCASRKKELSYRTIILAEMFSSGHFKAFFHQIHSSNVSGS